MKISDYEMENKTKHLPTKKEEKRQEYRKGRSISTETRGRGQVHFNGGLKFNLSKYIYVKCSGFHEIEFSSNREK